MMRRISAESFMIGKVNSWSGRGWSLTSRDVKAGLDGIGGSCTTRDAEGLDSVGGGCMRPKSWEIQTGSVECCVPASTEFGMVRMVSRSVNGRRGLAGASELMVLSSLSGLLCSGWAFVPGASMLTVGVVSGEFCGSDGACELGVLCS